MKAPREQTIVWTRTGEATHPFRARVGEQTWVIRLGDFPADPLYTLLVDGAEIESFDAWPPAWTRPPLP